jgi:hypothetical protein
LVLDRIKSAWIPEPLPNQFNRCWYEMSKIKFFRSVLLEIYTFLQKKKHIFAQIVPLSKNVIICGANLQNFGFDKESLLQH